MCRLAYATCGHSGSETFDSALSTGFIDGSPCKWMGPEALLFDVEPVAVANGAWLLNLLVALLLMLCLQADWRYEVFFI